jgi:hypothetical protein
MEHESFEDNEVAEVMNALYVNIKVDREERPDIDQVYMSALQLMNGNGGWPLNCILLPDQRPIYGGTYFRKTDWINILSNVAQMYRNKPEELVSYAEKLLQGVQQMERIYETTEAAKVSEKELQELYSNWARHLDYDFGGTQGAPKFPVPCNLSFLMKYHHHYPNEQLNYYLQNSLDRIARGGIYDQIGGGIYRYSVDGEWKIPHFEKMLYDQAQCISLYAEAYMKFKNPLYLDTMNSCIEFLENEMKNEASNCYYSALDADSEGQEGKYYCWTQSELNELLGEDANLMLDYFQFSEEGNFEHGLNNPYPLLEWDTFLNKHGMDLKTWDAKRVVCQEKMYIARQKKIRPNLDDKELCAWNCLLTKGFADAFKATGNERYRNLAINHMEAIQQQFVKGFKLYRNAKNGIASIDAFQDDYAFLIQALYAVYEITMELEYLNKAIEYCEACMKLFYDSASGLFFFTANDGEELIARKQEYYDSVIPSSNSIMMHNLRNIGITAALPDYEAIAERMYAAINSLLKRYPPSFANWINYALIRVQGEKEWVLIGEKAEEKSGELLANYAPNVLKFWSSKTSEEPVFANRFKKNTTLLYKCKNKACDLPLTINSDELLSANLN